MEEKTELTRMAINYKRNILITGGAGFIGCHVVRRFVNKYPDYRIVCMDILTYAGNIGNIIDVWDKPNFVFVRGDINDPAMVNSVLREYSIDGIMHLAAESHVDRSINDPLLFARTNVMGTLILLQAAKEFWNGDWNGKRFHHISTDEVFGSLELDSDVKFSETTPYAPHSPYSASKASSDHLVRAFHDTYGLPIVITNCSNNYGPFQFPEKLIPLCIHNIIERRPIPVYGTGIHVRDWLFVEDHAEALDLVFHESRNGETYVIGGNSELHNIDVVGRLVSVTDRLLGRDTNEDFGLINFVNDRAGHDLRYAIDTSKIKHELGWQPKTNFATGLETTVRWYLDNESWLNNIANGTYMTYYDDLCSSEYI